MSLEDKRNKGRVYRESRNSNSKEIRRGSAEGDGELFRRWPRFFEGARSFGSLIYTAAKLKRMRRPGRICKSRRVRGCSARSSVSHARKKGKRLAGCRSPKREEWGDYIVIREECWLDPSAGRVLALPSLVQPSWNTLSPSLSRLVSSWTRTSAVSTFWPLYYALRPVWTSLLW